MNRSRALGLALGFAADRLLGDPRRAHPVAGFGRLARTAEDRWYADSRAAGARHAVALVGGAAALGVVAERLTRGHGLAHTLVTAAATWAVLGGRSLEREATTVHAHLAAGDLPAARQRLTHLVSRDTSALDEAQVARAVVESVAENSSDAVVSSLVWGAVAGLPGLLAHRAANTMDAMVGYRDARYDRFGWASARLDDLLNLPGSRLTGACVVLLSGRAAPAAVGAWRQDAGHHPSPNAGVVESTFAASLGVRLGGPTTYPSGVQDRAPMGRGRPPRAADVDRAVRLARRVHALALGAVLVGAAVARGHRPGRTG